MSGLQCVLIGFWMDFMRISLIPQKYLFSIPFEDYWVSRSRFFQNSFVFLVVSAHFEETGNLWFAQCFPHVLTSKILTFSTHFDNHRVSGLHDFLDFRKTLMFPSGFDDF